ncbi:MAG TPA: DUF4261 domain-containing protein [Propionibacteriaceae bacterium]|nr:DUF4261 domain-containing protein [Propionibacteriaceae bacterium]
MTEGTPPDPAPSALVAELWFEQAPDLSSPELLEALQALSPDAQAQQDSLTVPYRSPRGNGQAEGGPDPLVTVVMPSSPLGEPGKQRPDARQTWDWADAEEAVARAGAGVLVTELLVAGWSPQDRVAAMTRVVAALAGWSAPVAVWWPHSQKVSDPETLAPDDLGGVVNVRFFSVAGDDEAMVLDTLGLHVFGLPDLQCHFRDRDPGEIAGLLYATALYVFDAGDVIADGNTISGPDGEGRYVCRRETSLLEPSRLVLDVDLGDPYAAGVRDR